MPIETAITKIQIQNIEDYVFGRMVCFRLPQRNRNSPESAKVVNHEDIPSEYFLKTTCNCGNEYLNSYKSFLRLFANGLLVHVLLLSTNFNLLVLFLFNFQFEDNNYSPEPEDFEEPLGIQGLQKERVLFPDTHL